MNLSILKINNCIEVILFIMNKIIITIFILLIYSPAFLTNISKIIEKDIDTKSANGNIHVDAPVFTLYSFWNNEYQKKYTIFFNSYFMPHNLLTKINNDIHYYFFNIPAKSKLSKLDLTVGMPLYNNIIGNNDDFFYDRDIYEYLSLNSYYDFSLPENNEKLQKYIVHLKSVQKKLAKFNKSFLVYFTPSKAHCNYENIPQKYFDISNKKSVKGSDKLKEFLCQSNINYFFSDELIPVINFPLFYHSGIHWSRPFEQLNSGKIIDYLIKITGKKYRNIVFKDIKSSKIPYYRDSDLYDIFNISKPLDEVYYEYEIGAMCPEHYDKMRILLQGDSFSEGLKYDILSVYPSEDIFSVFYNVCAIDPSGKRNEINGDWNKFDWQYYLDNVDSVVCELNYASIWLSSCGFVEALDKYLDSYIPSNDNIEYMRNFNAKKQIYKLDYDCLRGIYPKENGFAWTQSIFEVRLDNNEVSKRGLCLEYIVPEQLFINSPDCNVIIYVNGKKIIEKKYTSAQKDSIFISNSSIIKHKNDIYEIEVCSDRYFIPAEVSDSQDDRKLALQLIYVGSVE